MAIHYHDTRGDVPFIVQQDSLHAVPSSTEFLRARKPGLY